MTCTSLVENGSLNRPSFNSIYRERSQGFGALSRSRMKLWICSNEGGSAGGDFAGCLEVEGQTVTFVAGGLRLCLSAAVEEIFFPYQLEDNGGRRFDFLLLRGGGLNVIQRLDNA